MQCRAGAVDHAVESEEEAFACARRFLSYLPSVGAQRTGARRAIRPAERREEMLFTAIPRDRRQVYKMRPIIEALVDKGSFFEMGQMFGRSIITGWRGSAVCRWQ